jgi:Right handed beta helix region
VQAALAAAAPGVVICLAGGSYPTLEITAAGITVAAAPGASPIVYGFVEVKPGANDVRLTGLRIDGASTTQNTIQVWADNFTLDHSDVTNELQGSSCLYLGNPTYGIAHNPTIDGNRLHGCGVNYGQDHGIYADYPAGGKIINNDIYGNEGFGIQFYPGAEGVLFAHNVVDGNPSSGVIFAGSSTRASYDNTVQYNIFTNNGDYGIDSWWGGPVGTGNEADHNCFFGNAGGAYGASSGYARGGGDVFADPLYANRAAGDFHLQAGSPCTGMGPQ